MNKATAVADQYELVGRGLILLGAFVSFVLSVSLWFTGHHDQAIFVGLWVTLIVAVSVGLPVYGAILDGRYQAEQEDAEVLELSAQRAGRPRAA